LNKPASFFAQALLNSPTSLGCTQWYKFRPASSSYKKKKYFLLIKIEENFFSKNLLEKNLNTVQHYRLQNPIHNYDLL
jgi:hypothetical protein